MHQRVAQLLAAQEADSMCGQQAVAGIVNPGLEEGILGMNEGRSEAP